MTLAVAMKTPIYNTRRGSYRVHPVIPFRSPASSKVLWKTLLIWCCDIDLEKSASMGERSISFKVIFSPMGWLWVWENYIGSCSWGIWFWSYLNCYNDEQYIIPQFLNGFFGTFVTPLSPTHICNMSTKVQLSGFCTSTNVQWRNTYNVPPRLEYLLEFNGVCDKSEGYWSCY